MASTSLMMPCLLDGACCKFSPSRRGGLEIRATQEDCWHF